MALFVVSVIFCVLILATVWFRSSQREKKPRGLKTLPGPKGLPIIGSVHEVPEALSFVKFADWAKEYGPIYQVNLAGSNHVWISSDEIAKEVLAKKGAIYSDRPHIPALLDDNRDSGQYLPLMSQNKLWKRQRKFATTIMRDSEKADFHKYPELESIRLLVELMEDPSRYNHSLESYIARVTARLAWGRSEASDELKQRARELLISVSPTGAVGNKLPFLMSMPSWLVPAKAWEIRRAKTERSFFQIMQDGVEKEMNEKRANPSWTRLFLENKASFGFAHDLEGAYAVGMHGIAGALTIAAPMQVFCLAMAHNPEYLPMLQEELDRVCGDRMPTNADKPNLPFLRAVIRECFRWRPPVPTGIPHALTEDDEWNGYHIPKGSVMHPLEWAIARDPAMFPDPEAFNPLRWLKPEYPSYREPLSQYPTIISCTQFGYGRRTCQGQTVSEADLLVGIGAIAWLFDINREPKQSDEVPSGLDGISDESEEADKKAIPNLRGSISNEELNAGLSAHSSDDETERAQQGEVPTYPGAFPRLSAVEAREAQWAVEAKVQKKEKERLDKEDPTLNFTKLLIAKPVPFKFDLTVRNRTRAKIVREQFAQQKAQGEFVESRNYWGEENGKGKELGWGVV